MATAAKFGSLVRPGHSESFATGTHVRNSAKLRHDSTASTPGGNLARRRYQKGMVLFNQTREVWLGRYREDIIQADGSTVRTRPQIVLGTKKELPTQRLAVRKLVRFSHASTIIPISQSALRRSRSSPSVSGRKFSRSASRRRSAVRFLTLKLTSFHNSENFGSIRSVPRISKSSSTALTAPRVRPC